MYLNKFLELLKGDSNYKVLSEHVKKLDDFIVNVIIERLKIYDEIVNKYKPKVRPALDPYVASELGIYRRLDDWELGKFLGYPECCIKSFISGRVVIDNEHLKEVENIDKKVVLTAGFIPCSLKCKEAIKNGLIGYLDDEDFKIIIKVNEELKKALPHYHIFYPDYYEIIKE